jgi:hypothetical protein
MLNMNTRIATALFYLALGSYSYGIVATAQTPSQAPAAEPSIDAGPRASQTDSPAQLGALTSVDVKLKGYVFGIPMIKAVYQTRYTQTSYSVRSDLKTSGLGALLKKLEIWSTTTGFFHGEDLVPLHHVQQNLNKKHRRVDMRYGDENVEVVIDPKLGSQGQPPASPAERFESDDTLSALLNIMMRGDRTGPQPCAGTIPVFDSKQHYNLRLEADGTKFIKQKGFKGETLRCKVYYIPVSGFDPEDLPDDEEKSTPITMYLAHFPEAGLHIPVRMSYKIGGFKAVIKTRNIKISYR